MHQRPVELLAFGNACIHVMFMRVTFDTNTIDKACRPERFTKDPARPLFDRVHEALKLGIVSGAFPVSMLTIEGIARIDRATVFESSRIDHVAEVISTEPPEGGVPDPFGPAEPGVQTTYVITTLQASQPKRGPLHPEFVRRMKAAHDLGLRVLKQPPRIGAFAYDDPTGEWYWPLPDDGLGAWIDRIFAADSAITARGVGKAQVRILGDELAKETGKIWWQALVDTSDVHEEKRVMRAFSEWADGDAMAAHIAYGLDVFCTGDVGRGHGLPSILDQDNRSWLEDEYGVRFMTIEELAANLPVP